MNTIDRNSAKSLSAAMMKALEAVALEHGVSFRAKGGSFTSSNATFRIEAAVIGASGVAETKERTDYPLACHLYGFKPEWLDGTFNYRGEDYTIIGLNTRKHKNPVLGKRSKDGKVFVFPDGIVKTLMEAKEKATVTA